VEISKRFQKRNPYGKPVVCAVPLMVAVPLLCIGLLLVGISSIASQILFFLSGICLAMNKVLINEIILMVVLPNRRAWSFTEKSTFNLPSCGFNWSRRFYGDSKKLEKGYGKSKPIFKYTNHR
ncbi:hypothetical protein XENTR_v10007888, partial [Xenopus tropicalis]